MNAPEAGIGKRTIAVAGGALFLAFAGWLWFSRADAGRDVRESTGPKMWYTIDDGRTWFADDANKVVPFDHEGKKAYRCFVWTCDGGKTRFVSHLERIKPSLHAQFASKGRMEPWERMPGMEDVKAPLTGDSGWIDSDSPQASAITTPRCPDGKGSMPEPVRPE